MEKKKTDMKGTIRMSKGRKRNNDKKRKGKYGKKEN